MLKELRKQFDHYSIHARFMPAFFICLPLVLTTLAWCPEATTVLGSTITILISFGVMSFLSTIVSNMGNSLQSKLFNSWGGAPTTTILMPNNNELDKYTKERYFMWLNSRISKLNLAMSDDDSDLQDKIKSAANFLREFTRDTKKYPAVYRDNVAYGVARNLVALRYAGLLISIMALFINLSVIFFPEYYGIYNGQAVGNGSYPFGIISSLLSVLCVALYLFVLNERFIKQRAFRYARTLYEVCESKN